MTTENPRAEKVAVVEEVTAKLNAADAVIVTEYRGMSVGQLATLRRQLRASGGEYKVYKNTLARFGAEKAGSTVSTSCWSARAPSRSSAAMPPASPRRCATRPRPTRSWSSRAASIGGKSMSANDVEALADLPSRDVLLAMFAGAFQAPLVKTAGLLQALPRNFAYGLKALIDQKEAAA